MKKPRIPHDHQSTCTPVSNCEAQMYDLICTVIVVNSYDTLYLKFWWRFCDFIKIEFNKKKCYQNKANYNNLAFDFFFTTFCFVCTSASF